MLESPKYQQWLSFDEVGKIITNHDGFNASMKWLANLDNVNVTLITPRLEYIKADAPIHVWENAFQAKFYVFQDLSHPRGINLNAALNYSIPSFLQQHIQALT